MAEINVGQISEALNNKADRDLQNTQPLVGDYVVEWQVPTEENRYTWYRKYKSGWVEQGGHQTVSGGQYANQQINLPITMSNPNYSVQCTAIYAGNGDTSVTVAQTTVNLTSSTFYVVKHWASSDGAFIWEVKGFAAQS